MKLSRFAALAGIAIIAVGTVGCNAGGGGGAYKLGLDMPLQGSELAGSQPVINGAKLALEQAGGKAGSYTIELPDALILDDALSGVHDPQTGAANASTLIADTKVIGMIGPLNSNVAKAQIPLTNAAGLAQCSPANTNEGLTKPEFGALEVRKDKPNDINYVRVATTDDLQGPANAKYLAEDLGVKNLYIIDDTETFGAGIASQVEKYWKDTLKLTVVGHDSAPKTTTDYTSIMTAAAAKNPDGIYFGGVTASGGARILKAAIGVGLDVPYMGPDGINDGTGETLNSFLNLAGADAAKSYSTLAGKASFPGGDKFNGEYKTKFGIDATGYAIQGYVCMQILLDAIGRAAATNPSGDAAVREAVRKALSDPAAKYQTAMGEIIFDKNGDTSQKTVSVYSVDPAGANGKGAWVPKKEITFE